MSLVEEALESNREKSIKADPEVSGLMKLLTNEIKEFAHGEVLWGKDDSSTRHAELAVSAGHTKRDHNSTSLS